MNGKLHNPHHPQYNKFGLVLGLLAIYSRSLFPAMAFHFCNNAIATFHAAEAGGINADGVFFSRDVEGTLRYEAPLLILCGVAGALMVLHMIRVVVREQDQKRRGLIPRFGESPDDATEVSLRRSQGLTSRRVSI